MTPWYVGYDVAQASDFSAVSVIQTTLEPPYYRLRHLERLPRKTPYPEQVKMVVDLCDHIGRWYGSMPVLAVDFTGVGGGVYDMLRSSYSGQTKGITITGGLTPSVTDDGRIHRIPKIELISRLRIALESGHLKIARSLPEAESFTDELSNFELKVNEGGHVTMAAAGQGHDDLVLSVSLSLWFAHERHSGWGEQFVNPLVSKSPRPGNIPPMTFSFGHRKIPTLPVSNRRHGFM